MHELGIMIEVVKTVENFALQNKLTKIQMLILQIGELSSIVPQYVKTCYPAAVDGTMLSETELRIEKLPGNGRCNHCGQVYNLIENKRVCPKCEKEDFEVLSGREFMIKEIVAS